jgi:cation:H+ antiporter
MPVAVAALGFLAGALVSLAMSWVLVSRLERVGERLGLSEALLGIVAALAADAPEVTAAVAAMAGHQQRLGAGVVIGSNVFNLAALLGLGAVVAGRIRLHRRVVVFGGTVALCVAGVCLAVVLGLAPAAAGCVLGLVVVALYVAALGISARGLARLRLPRPWISWLRAAVAEEEAELESAIRPAPGRWPDAGIAAGSLVIVVAASVLMERAASALGSRFAIPEIVVGGLVLAAVTSLPNAVAAVYLAARGRGAASLSTALNSNTINVVAGLLIPAAVIGLGPPSGQAILITVWYAGLTAVILASAYRDRGIWRMTGILVIAAYIVFSGSVLGLAYAWPQATGIAIAVGLAVAAVSGAWLVVGRHPDSSDHEPGGSRQWAAGRNPGDPIRVQRAGVPGNGSARESARTRITGPCQPGLRQESLLAGWPVSRLWVLGVGISVVVAAIDAALGNRVVLIGLLIIGPCCVLLTGRWVPTALTGLWVTGLAVLLGLPDGIWGTVVFFIWLAAVAVVALVSAVAAAVIEIHGSLRLAERLTYALRGCSRPLLADSKPTLASSSQSAAAGNHRLFDGSSGHLGGTPRPSTASKGAGSSHGGTALVLDHVAAGRCTVQLACRLSSRSAPWGPQARSGASVGVCSSSSSSFFSCSLPAARPCSPSCRPNAYGGGRRVRLGSRTSSISARSVAGGTGRSSSRVRNRM